MTYEEAKELAIKEANIKRNGDYIYVLNVGKEYDIAHDLMEFIRDKLKEVFNIILNENTEFYLSYPRLSLDDLEPELIYVPMNDWLNAEYKEKEK